MRSDKTLLLEEIKEQFEQFDSFIIMRYLGLGANAANELREAIAEKGGNVEMTRKRILVKAAESSGVGIERSMLDGHIGLVFSGQDPIETTKFVYKFSRENGNAINIVGGRFDGQLYDAEQVEQLSKLPGKDGMRAALLGTLEAPMAQTVSVFNSLLCSVIICMDNKCKKEDSQN